MNNLNEVLSKEITTKEEQAAYNEATKALLAQTFISAEQSEIIAESSANRGDWLAFKWVDAGKEVSNLYSYTKLVSELSRGLTFTKEFYWVYSGQDESLGETLEMILPRDIREAIEWFITNTTEHYAENAHYGEVDSVKRKLVKQTIVELGKPGADDRLMKAIKKVASRTAHKL